MMLLLRWILVAATLLLITAVVPGFSVTGWYAALIAALFLGLANAVIRPILLLLTLPINILTLGLFTFVVNALVLWLVSSFVKGFAIAGFLPALFGALILWAVGSFVNNFLVKKS